MTRRSSVSRRHTSARCRCRSSRRSRSPDYTNPDFTRIAGAIDPVNINWHSWVANGSMSKLLGKHTVKLGVDYRFIGLDFQSFSNGAGAYFFDRRYTSLDPNANGVNGATPSGNAFASFLLGYPSGDPGNQSRVALSTPLLLGTNYYGFYAQDDFRMSPEVDGELRYPPRT
jgi:hypothetical protein